MHFLPQHPIKRSTPSCFWESTPAIFNADQSVVSIKAPMTRNLDKLGFSLLQTQLLALSSLFPCPQTALETFHLLHLLVPRDETTIISCISQKWGHLFTSRSQFRSACKNQREIYSNKVSGLLKGEMRERGGKWNKERWKFII